MIEFFTNLILLGHKRQFNNIQFPIKLLYPENCPKIPKTLEMNLET
jgi:hypothetical protein